MNTATEETFGWTRPEAVGSPFLELVVAPDDRGALADVLTAGSPLLGARLEISALRSDRRSFPAELAITRVDVPGPLLFAVSLRDVTKRHQHEERLRQAEAKYRTLVEQLPLATYVNSVGLPAADDVHEPADRAHARLPGLEVARAGLLHHACCTRRTASASSAEVIRTHRDRRDVPHGVPR